MKFNCPHCGQMIEEGQDFCPFCMEEVPMVSPERSETARKKTDIPPLIQNPMSAKYHKFKFHRKITFIWLIATAFVPLLVLCLDTFLPSINLVHMLGYLMIASFISAIGYGIVYRAFWCPFCGKIIAKYSKCDCMTGENLKYRLYTTYGSNLEADAIHAALYESQYDEYDKAKILKFMKARGRVKILVMIFSILSLAVFGLGRLLENIQVSMGGLYIAMIMIPILLVYGGLTGAFRCPMCGSRLQKHFNGKCESCGRRLY